MRLSSFYVKLGKRLLDLSIALPAIVLLSPIMLIVAIVVRVGIGAPVIFRQQRPGLGGHLFEMWKFRTMSDKRAADGSLLPDEYRLTSLGSWLRATSLDELPELFNILVGNMSLVGPRPLKQSYLPLYTPDQARRHNVLPGITGWAQVHGRNAISWEERLKLDSWYVDHCSLGTDLRILWMTIGTVLGRRGVSADGHSTMPDFQGSTPTSDSSAAVITSSMVSTLQISQTGVGCDLPNRNHVIVIGAGGHGKVIVSALQASGVTVEAVFDDDSSKHGQLILGVPVKGPISAIQTSQELWGVLGIGDNHLREQMSAKLKIRWLTVIHPHACVHPTVSLGEGTVVMAGVVIQPDVVIGRHCIINTSASIDHDGKVGDFSGIGPGARLAGTVSIGDRCMIGTGSSAIPSVIVGNDVTVGAGTVIIDDLPSGCTVVGATPRIIRMNYVGEFSRVTA